jgi:hypothetical protein
MPNKIQQRQSQWRRRLQSRKTGEDGGLGASASETAIRDKWSKCIGTFFEDRQKNTKKVTMELFSAAQRPYFGTTQQLPVMIATVDRELNDIKQEILYLKNDVLFGYLPKDLAVSKFQELKERATEKAMQLQTDYNEYFDLLENVEHIAHKRLLDRQYQMYLATYRTKQQAWKWKTDEKEKRVLLKDMAGLVVLMQENRAAHRNLAFSNIEFVVTDEEDGDHGRRMEQEFEETEKDEELNAAEKEEGKKQQRTESICVCWNEYDSDLFEKTTDRKFLKPPSKKRSKKAGGEENGKEDEEKEEEDKTRLDHKTKSGDANTDEMEGGVLSGDWIEDIEGMEDDKEEKEEGGNEKKENGGSPDVV